MKFYKDAEGYGQLAAFYKAEQEVSQKELRNFLKKKLPAYMLPNRYIHLQNFPLSINGKIDRSKLACSPNGQVDIDENNFPDNQILKKIRKIWQDVLAIESIGFNDNFYEIGGHSLKAIRLISTINKEFTINLSLDKILNHPTFSEFAALIEQSEENSNEICPIEDQEFYDLQIFQRRLWIIDQMLPDKSVYNIPLFYQVDNTFDLEIFNSVLRSFIEEHEILRTIVIEQQGRPKQKIITPQALSFSTDLLELEANKSMEQVLEQAIREPFILSTPPLFRVKFNIRK